MTEQPFRLAPQEFDPAVPLGRLHEHPANPNQGDVGAISESLDAHGFYGAVIAQKSTGAILAGNHRLRTAQMKGAQTIPTFWLDVDDEAALRILAVDNRTTHLATFDEAALVELLGGLASMPKGLAGTGYDGDDLDTLLARLGNGLSFGPDDAGTDGGHAETDEELAERQGRIEGYRDRKGGGALIEMILVFTAVDREEVNRLLGEIRSALGDSDARAADVMLRGLRVLAGALANQQNPLVAEIVAGSAPQEGDGGREAG